MTEDVSVSQELHVNDDCWLHMSFDCVGMWFCGMFILYNLS